MDILGFFVGGVLDNVIFAVTEPDDFHILFVLFVYHHVCLFGHQREWINNDPRFH